MDEKDAIKGLDTSILVSFSKMAKKKVLEKIRKHYGEGRANEKWKQVEGKYYEFLIE